MASTLYPLGKQTILTAGVNFTSDTIRCAMVTAAYTYSAAHQFFTSLAGVTGTPQVLASPTVNSPSPGVFDAADVTYPAVASGAAVNAVVIYKDTGSTATSPLIAYIDGIAVTPNGGDIIVVWDSGVNRIFSL